VPRVTHRGKDNTTGIAIISAVLVSLACPRPSIAAEAGPTGDGAKSGFAAYHLVGILANAQFLYELDRVVSPRAYRGVLGGGELFYEYRGEKNIHWFSLGAGVGGPKPRTDTVVGYRDNDGDVATRKSDPFQVIGQAEYAYHRMLKRTDRLSLGLGGALDAYISYFSATGFSWLCTYSLDLSALAEWRVAPRHTLVFRLHTPLLTFMSRPKWSIYDDEVMDRSPVATIFAAEPTSVHELARVVAEARYEIAVSRRIRLGVAYEISYTHATVPNTADVVSNTISVGASPPSKGGSDEPIPPGIGVFTVGAVPLPRRVRGG
jgi:hypothetical protein